MLNKTTSDINGILLIDKPAGLTSHDAVAFIRRKFKIKKVGHCGTLDPIATGLLVILLGRATKTASQYFNDDKKYLCTMKLGATTDTQDAHGEIIDTKDTEGIAQDKVIEAIKSFEGETEQIPPMVSAKHHKGVRLYKLARKGICVEREPSKIHIHDIEILSVNIPYAEFIIASSKGTYVRTLCHDIGEKLNCGAHMYKLRRLASGNFKTEDAYTLDQLKDMAIEKLREVITGI